MAASGFEKCKHGKQAPRDLLRELPEYQGSRSERSPSSDAYLYEGVIGCMKAARADERTRLVKQLSNGLKALLGDEFFTIMYELATQNDVNIGHD